MNNNVYALYNRLSCRYGDVMCYPSDSFAIKRVQEILKNNLDEFELVRIGMISVESGKLTVTEPAHVNIQQAVSIDDMAAKSE